MGKNLTLRKKEKHKKELHEKRNEKMAEDSIKIYPSNWLYNAGVIGFLKVLEKSEEKVEELLSDDGTTNLLYASEANMEAQINKIFEVWDNLFAEVFRAKGNNGEGRSYKDKKAGTKSYYYSNQTENTIKKRIKNLIENPTNLSVAKNTSFTCTFCGENESINKLEASFLNQSFGNILLTSEKTFPNSFWNMKSGDYICRKCQFIIMCHHISFIEVDNNSSIFINAPSFKMMWYLNKYASGILNRRKSYQLKEILAISFMELAQKVFTTIGVWSMMNIEMVIKSGSNIDYYCLPYQISKILLNKNIASLISQTKEDYILEIVLNGRFDSLLTMNHKVIHYIVTNSDPAKDKSLSKLKRKDRRNLKNLSQILPELYVKTNSILKER